MLMPRTGCIVIPFLRPNPSMLTKLEGLSSEVVHSNPYWQYKRDSYRLRSGRETDYWYASTHGSVFILAEHADGRFVLTKQYRYLNQRESLEFPGGGLAEGVEPELQARAELEEEAGFQAKEWTYLGSFNPMNGLTNELCHVFHAHELLSTQARPEESEEFELHALSAAQIQDAIRSRELWDGMTLAAWALYRTTRAEA